LVVRLRRPGDGLKLLPTHAAWSAVSCRRFAEREQSLTVCPHRHPPRRPDVRPKMRPWRSFSRSGLFLKAAINSGHVSRQCWWKAVLANQVTRPADYRAHAASVGRSRPGSDAIRSARGGSIVRDTMRRRFTHATCRKAHSSKQRYRLSDIAGRSLVWLPWDFNPGLLPVALILSARAFGLPAS